jgi:hypothetical protein
LNLAAPFNVARLFATRIGAGAYANNEPCAVSCTGAGAQIICFAVAYDIHAQEAYERRSIQDAAEEMVLSYDQPNARSARSASSVRRVTADRLLRWARPRA